MKSRSRPEEPWLSVVMPVHNGGRWLRQTLDSLVVQECDGIELIMLDSSEDDACERIVATFEGQLSIRYERTPDLLSWPTKTNVAVERAHANHVAMLHQDDLWLPNRATEIRRAIAALPDAILFLNPSYIIDEQGRRLGLWRCPLPDDRLLNAEQVARSLLVQNFVAVPAPVIQKHAWLKSGGMDDALWYTADWDMYLKLLRQGPTAYRTNPSTAFRVHSGSLTVSGSRNGADFEQQMKLVLDRHCDLVSSSELPQVRRRAGASIAINCALAQASAGRSAALLRAIGKVLSLGPAQTFSYLRDSRLLERALPRLRARFAGNF